LDFAQKALEINLHVLGKNDSETGKCVELIGKSKVEIELKKKQKKEKA
jgi:hypothetical protein